MDSLIPDLDRICPDCGCPSLTCVSTTATTWLGHCPSCGWQGSQALPTYPLPTANQSRRPANTPPTHPRINPDTTRIPLTHRHASSKRNLPLAHDAPEVSDRMRHWAWGVWRRPRFGPNRGELILGPILLGVGLWLALFLAFFNPDFAHVSAPTVHMGYERPTPEGQRMCGWDEHGTWACLTGALQVGNTWCGTNNAQEASCVVPRED